MTCKEKYYKILIKFVKEDVNKLIIHHYIVIVYMFKHVYICINCILVYVIEKIYLHTTNLVVKTPKCLDLLGSGSVHIDLCFWIFYYLLIFFYHKPYIVLSKGFKFLYLLCHTVNIFLKLS